VTGGAWENQTSDASCVIGGRARFGGSAQQPAPRSARRQRGVVESATEAGAEPMSTCETFGAEFGAVLASARAGE